MYNDQKHCYSTILQQVLFARVLFMDVLQSDYAVSEIKAGYSFQLQV